MTAKAKLIGLLDYVEELARLPERAVLTVRSYRTLLFYEHQLRGKVGIYHDVAEEDGAIWLRIDRLQRQPPPGPNDDIRPWLTVSRDPTKPPEVHESIILSMTRDKSESLLHEGSVDADDVMMSPTGDANMVDVRLRLDRFPELIASIEEYNASSWIQWASAEIPIRETIAIYDKFFSVLQAIETAGVDNPLEVVFGVGFALWRTQGNTIEHPIVEALVEASIDPQTHAIQVRARDTDPQVYLKPFVELDNLAVPSLRKKAMSHFERILGADAEVDAQPCEEFSPFNPGSFEPILRDAVTLLSPEASYWPDIADDPDDRVLPEITDVLKLSDNWAIYARPRSGNLFAQDIQRLKGSIEDSEDDELPIPGKRLVTPPSEVGDEHTGPDLSGGFGTGWDFSANESAGEQGADNADVLFPKPFNNAQVAIIRRLEGEDAVVVQGPPGTGKTHTIANIICHYLATGRSVLVVSKGEPALEVLRDQIPDEVRNLTISLLTSERQGLKQLEAAVTFMANQVVNKDMSRLDRLRIEKEKEIVALRQEVERLDAEITSWAKKQLVNVPESLSVDSKRWPADLARIISDQKDRHQWLDDEIGAGDEYEPRFTQQQLGDLRAARCRLGENLPYLDAKVPNRNDLPDARTISAVHDDLLGAASLADAAEKKQLPLITLRTEEAVRIAERLQTDLVELREFLLETEDHGWLRTLYETWIKSGVDADETKLIGDVVSDIGRLAETRKQFIQRPVSLPNLRVVVDSVVAAVRRAKRGDRPFPLISFGNQDTKKYLEGIEVSGRSPNGTEDWKHVSDFFDYRDELLSVVTRWNAAAQDFGLPTGSRDPSTADRWLANTQNLLNGAIRVASCYRNRTSGDVASLFQHDVDRAQLPFDVPTINRVLEAVETNISRHKLASARSTVDAANEKLRSCSGHISDTLRAFLRHAIGDVTQDAASIGEEWRELLAEVQRVHSSHSDLETVRTVTGLIEKSGATKWAQVLRTCAADVNSDPHLPSDSLEAWRFHRVKSYLRGIDARSHLAELATQQTDCTLRLDRAMADVVQHRTYIGLHKRMQRGGRLSALMRFLHAIRQIGAGTGVRARRYRGDARKAMLECMESVPCWIMPTWRVSESLPASLGAFDLVIVDEASQSDVLALPTLLRAKKVLVVGDDRQVSPSPVGLEERKLLQLRYSYLQDQPFADMLMPGTSLYDLAQAVFSGGRILLNEHFRCVEPIIRFSLQFYPEEIVPLRIPAPSERLDPPLVDVLVSNGRRDGNKVNKAEAIAIVDEIERLVQDPAYHERSIGVISLIGNKQANVIQNQLVERIGEDAFLRHRIACGDSATFQGKERDVMFLSMVASPGMAHAQVSRLFEQRFNVALSRARDRMYLFRSVRVEDLPNPRDLKLRVINHFRNPMPAGHEQLDELGDLCESDFEKDVFSRLVHLGYRVTPQMSVGDYRIDLVVDGDNDRRLAVELDGDRFHGPDRWFDDYRRQKVLERVGWRFWRCWASSFSLDREGCMSDLVGVLQGMKIEPIGQAQERHAFTEYRTVDTDELQPVVGIDEDDGTGEKAEAGDKVIVAFDAEPNRHYLLTLSEDDEDLANGIVSVRSETGTFLLGARAEDEVDLAWKGETRHAVILEIHKTNGASVVDPLPPDSQPRDVFHESATHQAQVESSRHMTSSGGRSVGAEVETFREPERQQSRRAWRQEGKPAKVTSGRKSLLPDEEQTSEDVATNEEQHKYEEYSEGLRSAGLSPRPMPEWLEVFRKRRKNT